jgi:hypothetical protein
MMATKKAVAMGTRVAGEDEGDGKSSKCDGNGDKEGICKKEGNGDQQRQQEDGVRDNNDAENTMTPTMMLTTMMKKTKKMTKAAVQWRWLAVAGDGGGGQ